MFMFMDLDMNRGCNCPECGGIFELYDMKEVEPNKLCCHNKVCPECYDNLETDSYEE